MNEPALTSEGSPIDRDLLRQCVHCGLCLDACPTYVELGREPDSPRGRIHLATALSYGEQPLTEEVVRHFDLCLGCRACETACPSGVSYGRILEQTRSHIERETRRGRMDTLRRRMVLELFPHPNRLAWLVSLVRLLQGIGLWPWVARWVPGAALFPELGEATNLRSTAEGKVAAAPAGRVGFLRGCVADAVQPHVNAAAVRVLERCGLAVEVAPRQGCCGALHLHAGELDRARELARTNIDAFAGADVSSIVVTAAGCGAAMREYGELLCDDAEYRDVAKSFAAKVRDITEVVDEVLPPEGQASGEHSVTYHDACHLAHAQGVRERRAGFCAESSGRTSPSSKRPIIVAAAQVATT